MRKIHLYGYLKKEFGAVHEMAVETVAEAIEALRVNFAGFAEAMRKGHFKVIVGENTRKGLAMSEDMLPGLKLGEQNLHIVPAAKGAKRGGLGKIIAGVALIGLSLITGGALGPLMTTGLWAGTTVGTVVGSVGLGLVMTGVASFIAPEVEAPDDKKSYTMSGPQTTTREGGIVPIVYGEAIVGGTMVSGSLSIEQKD